MNRFQFVSKAIEQARWLTNAGRHEMDQRITDPGHRDLPWMPFELFDFIALLLESVPLIPEPAPVNPPRFLCVGAGPGPEMVIARDIFGMDVFGYDIDDALAQIARGAGLPVETADAADWTGYEKYDCIWVNRPHRAAAPERVLEGRIYHDMAPGAVLICANTETRPPQSWIIAVDMWDDMRRGAWVKPYPHPEGGG